MLKSCKHCQRIHDKKELCSSRPVYKKNSELDKFRWSGTWQIKRVEIKERDNYLCQVCTRNLYDTLHQYTYNNVQVHHIISLSKDFDKRLDDDNLVTLCLHHHEMAENGNIKIDELIAIARQQNAKNSPGVPV